MKALSVKQPWAWAICNLPKEYQKDIENRTWKTTYHGDFLIHASKSFDKEGYERLVVYLKTLGYQGEIPKPHEFVKGAIIGISYLNRIANNNSVYFANTDSIWYEGEFGFMLEDSRALINPIPLKGKLNFFEVDNNLVRSELEKIVKKTPIDNYEFKIGDVVLARPDAFDVITKFTKQGRQGTTYFKTEHKIKDIEGDLCGFTSLGFVGWSWYHKDDLILKESYEQN